MARQRGRYIHIPQLRVGYHVNRDKASLLPLFTEHREQDEHSLAEWLRQKAASELAGLIVWTEYSKTGRPAKAWLKAYEDYRKQTMR